MGLDELSDLYSNPGWRGTAYGGNGWLPITLKVRELGVAIDAGDEPGALRLVGQILQSSHNTGKVGDKLKELDT